jgi:hypothetical protein
MVVITQLPEGLKKSSFEKNDPKLIGGYPPVRFVNYPQKKMAGEKLSFVKIMFSKSVTKNFEIFVTGDMEAAIKLIMVHETILTDLKLKEQVKANRELVIQKRISLARLNQPTSRASRADKEALAQAIQTLEEEVMSLQSDSFDHFEKLLSPTLQPQWKDIVHEECEGVEYVNLKGEVPGAPRGRVLSSMRPCYLRFLKLFGPQDSAERMQRYMATNISMNTDIISVRQGIGRFQEMNKLLSYMPCLRHKKDSPAALKYIKEYSALEMCTHILASIPLKLNTAYHSGNQDSFAIDVSVLVLRLEAANSHLKQTKTMLRGYVDSELGKQRGTSGGRMSADGERIPRKSAKPHSSNKNKGGGDSGDKTNAQRGKTKEARTMECELCAQWHPHAKNTHWTSDCTRFNKDGSKKGGARAYGGKGGGGLQSKYVNTTSLTKDLEKNKKKLKKLKKKYKRQKKRSKKGRDYESSSSSDSSSYGE